MPLAILANRMCSLAADARLGFRGLARRWHRIDRATRARIEFGAVVSLLPLSAAIAAIAAAPAALDLDGLQPRPSCRPWPRRRSSSRSRNFCSGRTAFVREARVERGDTLATLLERLDVRDNAALAFLRSDPSARPLVRLAPGRFLQANATADGELNWLKVYLGGDADALPGGPRGS